MAITGQHGCRTSLLYGQRERPPRFLLGASGLLCTRQDANLQPSDP